ncbi:MAG TPA: hypothetical protein VIV60_15180, partial [Polyangiaceae bacterium]
RRNWPRLRQGRSNRGTFDDPKCLIMAPKTAGEASVRLSGVPNPLLELRPSHVRIKSASV